MLEIYTAEELEDLCKLQKGAKNIKYKFWTAEVYSIGKYMRKYAFYPHFLPLYVYTDHGVGGFGGVFKHELENDSSVQFYHNKKKRDEFKKLSKKPCYTLYSPQIFYRQSNNIQMNPETKGTIAFPSHTTASIDNEFDKIGYINDLKALPEEFQPVSICLHEADIKKGEHKIYLKNGLNVYTAGNTIDDKFIERFYDILKHFKYSTSNMVGSYTYYSVEMDIPFFIYGEREKFVNYGDPNIDIGEFDLMKLNEYKEAYELFNVPISNEAIFITEEQKQHMFEGTGLKDGLSRWQLCFVLYWAFLAYTIKNFFFSSEKIKPKCSPLNLLKSIKNKNVYLYGAGIFAEKLLKNHDFHQLNIKGFIDGDINKKGKNMNGYEIFYKDEIKELAPDIIFLCVAEPNIIYYDIVAFVLEMGLNIIIIPDFFEDYQAG